MMNMVTKESIMKTTVTGTNDKTYAVTREFVEAKGDVAILIALYPTISAEEANVFDTTSRHMIAHMPELKIKSLIMVNLFPKILNGSLKGVVNLEYDEDNLKFIIKLIAENPDAKVIISWGSNLKRNKTVNRVKKDLLEALSKEKPTRVLQLTTDYVDANEKDGIHALFLGLRNGSDKWKLVKYNIRSELERINDILTAKPKSKGTIKSKEKKLIVE